jgi:hypothetical protein
VLLAPTSRTCEAFSSYVIDEKLLTQGTVGELNWLQLPDLYAQSFEQAYRPHTETPTPTMYPACGSPAKVITLPAAGTPPPGYCSVQLPLLYTHVSLLKSGPNKISLLLVAS